MYGKNHENNITDSVGDAKLCFQISNLISDYINKNKDIHYQFPFNISFNKEPLLSTLMQQYNDLVDQYNVTLQINNTIETRNINDQLKLTREQIVGILEKIKTSYSGKSNSALKES